MALNFENVYQDADFLPSPEEMERNSKILTSTDKDKDKDEDKDEYDNLGRNITEQARRQNKVPWVKVKYVSGRLFINRNKRAILRSMNLF